jgi:transposase
MVYIKSFKGQNWLLPLNIQDMIPADHICFLVEESIDNMDFSDFDEKVEGAGHPAYHPRILLKVLVQGMLIRFVLPASSKELARKMLYTCF